MSNPFEDLKPAQDLYTMTAAQVLRRDLVFQALDRNYFYPQYDDYGENLRKYINETFDVIWNGVEEPKKSGV